MNVYDKAHELARALKLAPEVVEYKSAMEKINSNPNHKRMIEDFRKKQFELYSQQLKGVEPSKEQVDSLNNLLNIISLNPEIRNYLEAEMRFSRLWEDIMKILGDAIDIDFAEEFIKK